MSTEFRRRPGKVAVSLIALSFVATSITIASEPYVSTGFLRLPSDIEIGAMSAVAVDGRDRIYVLHRGEPPLLVLDGDQKLLAGWGRNEFKTVHGLRVDSQHNVWVTDNALHVIKRFSRDGEITLTLGQSGKPASGENGLRSPDDLVFDSKGFIFVADAGNKRVAKFTPDGKYVMEWGGSGKEPGRFATAHGIAVDANDRIYVADRGNNRVQVFTNEGKLISAWTQAGNPFGLLITPEGLIVADGDAHRLTLLNSEGQSLGSWGSPETLKLPHLMSIDQDGVIYVTEVDGKRIQTFKRAK